MQFLLEMSKSRTFVVQNVNPNARAFLHPKKPKHTNFLVGRARGPVHKTFAPDSKNKWKE